MLNRSPVLKSTKFGFTLIELSIVLVIIGLIIGGLLVGRDLIEAAAARADISQIEQVKTAVNTFKLKYNGLPGDIANATRFFPANGSYAANGDGNIGEANGSVGNYVGYCSWGCADKGYESTMFWRQLALAGLINNVGTDFILFDSPTNNTNPPDAKPGRGYPINKGLSNSGLSITSVPGGLSNIFIYGWANVGASQTIATTSNHNPFFSRYIDTKIDDGLARTGKVQNKWTLDTSFTGASCHNTSTGEYLSSASNIRCTLRIESGF